MTTLITIIFTALLSALVTWGAAWLVFTRFIWPQLEKDLEAEINTKVQEIGDALEARVREGVRKGVLEGVSQIPSAEVLRGTTESMVRTGQSLVEKGVGTILGTTKKR